jgi:hypothetical protein
MTEDQIVAGCRGGGKTGMAMEAACGRGTSTGEGTITIEAGDIDGFRRWTQQLQTQYNPPAKPRSKRGQRKRTWGHG